MRSYVYVISCKSIRFSSELKIASFEFVGISDGGFQLLAKRIASGVRVCFQYRIMSRYKSNSTFRGIIDCIRLNNSITR